jgi:hypothetical protein
MAVYRSTRDGVWRVIVWANGKRHETTVRGDEAEARRREVTLKMEHLATAAKLPTAKPQVNRKRYRLAAERAEPWRVAIAAALEANGCAPDSSTRLRPRSAFVPRNRQTSWLYAVQTCGDTGPVKFGRAYNVAGRMTQIQTGCPFEMVVLGVCSGGDVEGVIHDGLRRFHLRGEWYEASAPVLEIARVIHDAGKAEGSYVACGMAEPAERMAACG